MTSESEKICILLKSVGNAPVLKKDKFMLGKTTKLSHVFKIFWVCISWIVLPRGINFDPLGNVEEADHGTG